MIGNTAVRVMERIAVASFYAGSTLAGEEHKVTQWLLVHLSTTGPQMVSICSIGLKFLLWAV